MWLSQHCEKRWEIFSQNLYFSPKFVKISRFEKKKWQILRSLEKKTNFEKNYHNIFSLFFPVKTRLCASFTTINNIHITRCNKHNCASVSEEWSYLLWKSIFSKEFLHQLHQLDGAVSLMLASVLNIDFQRIYDNFSETPDSLFLLHSVQQPKSTHWQHATCVDILSEEYMERGVAQKAVPVQSTSIPCAANQQK